MHKEVQTARASRFKYTIIGVFILLVAGFVFANARSTSATLKVLGFGTNQLGDFVLLRLINSGPGTIVYRGCETNYPLVALEFQTLAGRRSISRNAYNDRHYYFSYNLEDVELKPHQSVDFRVLTSDMQHDFQVTLTYYVPTAPGPLDWLRYHAPYQISRWLPRSHSKIALTPLIKSNWQLAGP